LANHEQDQTAGAAPAPPGTDRDGQSQTSALPANCPSGIGEADGGTFRWPTTGLPRLFGQPAGEPEPDDDPFGPLADADAPGPGYDAAPGREPGGEDDLPDAYPLAEYGPADVGEQIAGPLPLPDEEPPHWRWPETADSLTADLLLPSRHARPASGWRRVVYQATGGLVHPQESAAGRHRRELLVRACTPVAAGHHRVAVLSLKGGVGKTTTAMGLGSTLASLRGDRVIAVDANPDRGTLSDKIRLETAATIRDLLNERDQILRYADVRAFTTQAPSRLEVLASDRDPTVSVALSDRDYEEVAQVLEHYYSVCITDCGTGLLHLAMAGVLRLADQIVLVSSPSVDGARSASATLDWLQAHGYGDLVRDAVVVVSVVRPRGKSTVDLGRLEQHFATRCRAVVRVPYDAHLEEGAEVDLDQLSRATADAYLALAAEVGDGFNRPHRGEEIG
jgi:MinD-like ATPase involved in chromosome partitioning or flagellar assembly